MKEPYIGFTSDTIQNQPSAQEGQLITCPTCGGKHPLECGTSTGVKSNLILFYQCGDKLYMGALDGHLMIGVKSDVHGEVEM